MLNYVRAKAGYSPCEYRGILWVCIGMSSGEEEPQSAKCGAKIA